MAEREPDDEVNIEARKQAHLTGAKASGNPDASQLTAINRYTLDEVAAEDVYVRTAYLAHNGIDRDGDVFDVSLLGDFARTLPGKGLFISHPGGWDGDKGPGVGRWFDARVVPMSTDQARSALGQPDLQWPPGEEQAQLLEASFYLPRISKNEDLATEINTGVASDVSIGFRASSRSDIQDANGNVIAQRLHGPGEAFEGSLVWLGAQPGARVHKSANIFEESEEKKMDQVKELQSKLDKETERANSAEERAKAAENGAATTKALADALGVKEDAIDIKAIAEAMSDAKAVRSDLVERYIAAKRLHGVIGDDETQVNEAKEFAAGMTLGLLRRETEAAEKTAPKGGQLNGSDPNAGPDKHGKPDEQKDMTNPLDNPAMLGAA